MGSVRRRPPRTSLWYVLGIGMLAAAAEAQPAGLHGVHQPVRRQVLALTSTAQSNRSSDFMDHLHDRLQMPLNHLGMVVREHDVKAGPPDHIDLRQCRAILTCFQGGEPAVPWLWAWLEQAVQEHDLRIIHFGDVGPLVHSLDGPPHQQLSRWLDRFGLAWEPDYEGDPLRIDVEFDARESTCWESVANRERSHTGPWSWGADNTVWVRTSNDDNLGDLLTPVVTGPWGGVALYPWALHEGWRAGDFRWHIDPFRFFSEALGLTGVPAPEPSVLLGRRMLVLHIDGDGFESLSTVQPGALSAKVMLDQVLDRYRLPVTVSVIVASLTNDLEVETPTPRMVLAKEILNRPYVEPASHTVLHPQDWRGTLTTESLPRTITWYPPIANYRHDMAAEVSESVRFINERLLDRDRRCRIVLWSGMCNPSEASVRAATDSGCWNMNGGEFRWDPLYDSAGFVSPWGKQLGSEFQVYCGAANENVFAGFFTTMPGAFGHVDRTIRHAGQPRILKPANLYFHFYSAERPARLRALQHLIERWAHEETTIAVPASTYASAVHSAQTGCNIQRTPGGWSFSDFAHCKTVRIDGETKAIDWVASTGLLGANRIRDSLYVHLAQPEAELVWGDAAQSQPYVEHADHPIREARLTRGGIDFVSEAILPRRIVLAGLPPTTAIAVEVDGVERRESSDTRGRLGIEFNSASLHRVRVRVR